MTKRIFFALLTIIMAGGIAVVFGDRIVSSASIYLFGMRMCQPDNRLIYISDLQVWSVDERGGARQMSIQDDLPKSRVAKSPNHRYIAYSVRVENYKSRLYVACADGSQAYAVTAPHVETVFSWLNADTLAYSFIETDDPTQWDTQGQSFTIDVLSKQVHEQENPFQYPQGQYLVNPNNHNVVSYAEKHGDFWLADRQAGTRVRIASVPVLGEVNRGQWSADGKRVAFVLDSIEPLGQARFNTHSGIYVFELDSGTTRQLVDVSALAKDESTADLQWSPDNRWLAFTVTNANRREGDTLYAVSLDDGNAINLGVRMTMFYWLAWSPDSRQIAFTSDVIGKASQKDIFTVSVSTRQVSQLTNSPDYKDWLSW